MYKIAVSEYLSAPYLVGRDRTGFLCCLLLVLFVASRLHICCLRALTAHKLNPVLVALLGSTTKYLHRF